MGHFPKDTKIGNKDGPQTVLHYTSSVLFSKPHLMSYPISATKEKKRAGDFHPSWLFKISLVTAGSWSRL